MVFEFNISTMSSLVCATYSHNQRNEIARVAHYLYNIKHSDYYNTLVQINNIAPLRSREY